MKLNSGTKVEQSNVSKIRKTRLGIDTKALWGKIHTTWGKVVTRNSVKETEILQK
ncbi:MAG: hypothetical protein II215_04130 [Paludibacteraceae bacterium]|nr:hypothetical protein [Paludibacteraceae bacterium]